jgi:Alpha/beta hydrolase of unknown function (DUF1400)
MLYCFNKLSKNCAILLGTLFTGIEMVLSPLPASASEQIILSYSILRESISVSELRTLVDTGETSSSLKNYLEKANTKPEELQQTLTKEVEVNPVRLSKILNSYPGELVLDLASEVIQTPSGKASRESLRGALVSSAIPDGNVRIIEVLENYPTSEVHVDGDRLVELYNTMNNVVGSVSQIENIINQL